MAIDPDQVKEAERELSLVRDDWLERHGVISLEVARRWDGDSPTDDVCIRVTVERVLDPDDVPAGELFPRSLGDTRIQVRQGTALHPE